MTDGNNCLDANTKKGGSKWSNRSLDVEDVLILTRQKGAGSEIKRQGKGEKRGGEKQQRGVCNNEYK